MKKKAKGKKVWGIWDKEKKEWRFTTCGNLKESWENFHFSTNPDDMKTLISARRIMGWDKGPVEIRPCYLRRPLPKRSDRK